jgi:hypothetical protein
MSMGPRCGVPGTTHQAMLVVGVVEVLAGVFVAVAPRMGGYVVAAWLAGIIVNLLLLGDLYDVALRAFGLLVGALALARRVPAARSLGVGVLAHGLARNCSPSPPDPVPAGGGRDGP